LAELTVIDDWPYAMYLRQYISTPFFLTSPPFYPPSPFSDSFAGSENGYATRQSSKKVAYEKSHESFNRKRWKEMKTNYQLQLPLGVQKKPRAPKRKQS